MRKRESSYMLETFCERKRGRRDLRTTFHGGRSCARGGDEDESVGVSDSLVTSLLPVFEWWWWWLLWSWGFVICYWFCLWNLFEFFFWVWWWLFGFSVWLLCLNFLWFRLVDVLLVFWVWLFNDGSGLRLWDLWFWTCWCFNRFCEFETCVLCSWELTGFGYSVWYLRMATVFLAWYLVSGFWFWQFGCLFISLRLGSVQVLEVWGLRLWQFLSLVIFFVFDDGSDFRPPYCSITSFLLYSPYFCYLYSKWWETIKFEYFGILFLWPFCCSFVF